MAKKLKCNLCNEYFDKEDLTIKGAKKYCTTCLPIFEEEKKKNKNDWDLLYDYICNLYNIKIPTGMMFKQMKDFREEYEYTNIGMYYTLKYYYEILENKVLEGTGLGIIPYFYDKAKIHYNKVFDLEEVANNFENTEQSVKIKTKLLNKNLEIKKPLPLNINWEGLNEDN